MTNRKFFLSLVLILLAGLAVRLPGVWWGFREATPSFYHPDENRINRQVVNLIHHGESRDYYPDGYARLLALLTRHRDPLPETWRDTVFAARLVSVAYSTATIALLAWLAWLLGLGKAGALVAAAGFAFSGVAVAHAHFGVTDSALVFWLALSMALAVALRRHPWMAVLCSAVTGGYALSVKLAWPTIFPSVLSAFRSKRAWILAPFSLLLLFFTFRTIDPDYTWADFAELRKMVRVENVQAVQGHTYHWNPIVLMLLLIVGVGLPFAVLAMRGSWEFGRAGWRRWLMLDHAVVWAPTLGYVLNFLMVSVCFPRHVLPMLPALSLAMAAGWKVWMRGRSSRVYAVVLGLLMLYQGAYLFTIERAYWRDTRQDMDVLLAEYLPADTSVHGSPYISLHAWESLDRLDLPYNATHVLIHEADYWRYRRSAIHPFTRNPMIRNVYRPGGYGQFYWSLIRNRTPFVEIHRVPWRALTPELMIHKRFWGSYPEFVGDTVLYERQD